MGKENTELHKGGCLCGAVRFSVEGPPVVVAHCHCEDCQRSSGAGHTTGAMFSTTNFKSNGKLSEFHLTSENNNRVTKSFCPTCGSSLFGRNTAMDGYVTIALGTFDDASMFEPEVVVFARNKQPWDIMDETLATFNAQPSWKPD